jgi:ribonuclease HII
LLYYETNLKKKGFDLIIGVDEAGRGPLAGPVVAAAVALNTYRFKNRIDDSKKLTALSREKAFLEIIDKSVFGIGIIDEKIIDRVNILQATRLAMEQAINFLVDKLVLGDLSRIHVIVDGNMELNIALPYTKIISTSEIIKRIKDYD